MNANPFAANPGVLQQRPPPFNEASRGDCQVSCLQREIDVHGWRQHHWPRANPPHPSCGTGPFQHCVFSPRLHHLLQASSTQLIFLFFEVSWTTCLPQLAKCFFVTLTCSKLQLVNAKRSTSKLSGSRCATKLTIKMRPQCVVCQRTQLRVVHLSREVMFLAGLLKRFLHLRPMGYVQLCHVIPDK